MLVFEIRYQGHGLVMALHGYVFQFYCNRSIAKILYLRKTNVSINENKHTLTSGINVEQLISVEETTPLEISRGNKNPK